VRLNRTGVLIIATFLGVGLAMAIVPITIVRVMGAIYLLGTLIAIAVVARLRWRVHHNRWLAEHGIRGRCTVVAASSQISVNEQPIVTLTIDVEVPGQPQRRLTRKLVVAAFAARRLRPGTVLPVYAHPRDADDILVVW
jgi:hypothetical protein